MAVLCRVIQQQCDTVFAVSVYVLATASSVALAPLELSLPLRHGTAYDVFTLTATVTSTIPVLDF